MRRPPQLGFGALRPSPAIAVDAGAVDYLPSASTCTYLLRLSRYSSRDALRTQLLRALAAMPGFELA